MIQWYNAQYSIVCITWLLQMYRLSLFQSCNVLYLPNSYGTVKLDYNYSISHNIHSSYTLHVVLRLKHGILNIVDISNMIYTLDWYNLKLYYWLNVSWYVIHRYIVASLTISYYCTHATCACQKKADQWATQQVKLQS